MKIALIGYGKMGRTLDKLAQERGHEVLLRIHSSNKELFTQEYLKSVDLAIEFTNPNEAENNIRSLLKWGIPVVSGTTAWIRDDVELKRFVEENNGCLFHASNYSMSMYIFNSLLSNLTKAMSEIEGYDVEMKEIHHKEKKDAPSGTAILLAKTIISNHPVKTQWINEKAQRPEQLTILSEREDDVPGTHEISFKSAWDEINIEHVAHSREGFATGAILAAEWVFGKKGFFGMKDMLKL